MVAQRPRYRAGGYLGGGGANEAIRRGNFVSVGGLVTAIRDYLDPHNLEPKPFVWSDSKR